MEINITWTIDDVLMQATKDNVNLNKKEALTVLKKLKQNHDATIGINWEVISETIKIFEREKTHEIN